jgi:hypothetical protein
MKGLFCWLASVALTLAISARARASSLPIDTDVVKKSLVFLYYTRDGGLLQEVGTGFLVGIPRKSDPTQIYLAIVTARHVVDPQWAGCSWSDPRVLTARVNTNNYKSGDREIGVWETSFNLVANGQTTWFVHSDDRIDLAVIPIDSKIAEAMVRNETKFISLSDFGTEEEIDKFKIGIGDEIISAGLVPELLDARRNYPAFKFGRVSNVFREPMKMRCEAATPQKPATPIKDRLGWLLAGNFVTGNSGSPVYLLPIEFTIAPPLQFNGPRTMLLGVLSGTIEGADLGMMVPVESIFDIVKEHYPDGDLYRGDLKDKPPVTAPPR